MISFPSVKLDFCPRCGATLPQRDYDLQRCSTCGWVHGENRSRKPYWLDYEDGWWLCHEHRAAAGPYASREALVAAHPYVAASDFAAAKRYDADVERRCD